MLRNAIPYKPYKTAFIFLNIPVKFFTKIKSVLYFICNTLFKENDLV